MQTSASEMEKKYLIKDERAFTAMLGLLTKSPAEMILDRPLIKDYRVRSFESKGRDYRYFDTFEGSLEQGNLFAALVSGPLERAGATASVRRRERDLVFAVKARTETADERTEDQFNLPDPTQFYTVDPNALAGVWPALAAVRAYGQNMPLQEVVRLHVDTNRFNLYVGEEHRIEVALDYVTGKGFGRIQRSFHELEVEVKSQGSAADKEGVAQFFVEQYGPSLVKSSLPKWIKMLRLIRGEEIVPD